MAQEAVVGTTFTFRDNGPKKIDDFKGTIVSEPDDNVKIKNTPAILIPEPDNQFDPGAVMVVTELTDGSAFRLGYLGKGSYLYEHISEPTPATLIISAYSEVGPYNDKFEVSVDI